MAKLKLLPLLFLMTGFCGVSHAAVNINVNEVLNLDTSTDIVFEWDGSLDLSDMTVSGNLVGGFFAFVRPQNQEVKLFSSGNTLRYTITGPGAGTLGTGGQTGFTSTTGTTSFGVDATRVSLSENYVSNSNISGESTIVGMILADIGLNPGSYTWTIAGSNDTITMNVVPEPSTYAALLGALALGAVALRRKRRG